MTLTAPGHPPADTGPGPAGKMHFCVDGWDPTHGTSLELAMVEKYAEPPLGLLSRQTAGAVLRDR